MKKNMKVYILSFGKVSSKNSFAFIFFYNLKTAKVLVAEDTFANNLLDINTCALLFLRMVDVLVLGSSLI